jgi:hypothetical protein
MPKFGKRLLTAASAVAALLLAIWAYERVGKSNESESLISIQDNGNVIIVKLSGNHRGFPLSSIAQISRLSDGAYEVQSESFSSKNEAIQTASNLVIGQEKATCRELDIWLASGAGVDDRSESNR